MKKASMISTMHQTEVQKLDQYFFHAAHEWMGKKPSKAIVLVKKRWKFQLFNRFLAEMFDVIKTTILKKMTVRKGVDASFLKDKHYIHIEIS